MDELEIQGLRQRIEDVKGEIARVAAEAGRAPDDITLIGVSKVFPWEYAAEAFKAGLVDLVRTRSRILRQRSMNFKVSDLSRDGI